MTNIFPSLSLSMIVKNEADVLSRCLKSISSLVDEIIIVDTGSTDATVEIARSFGAKVCFYAWDGSFCNARNFSLAQASGQWVLVLDADEILRFDNLDQLHKLLQDQSAEGYFLKVINLLGTPSELETSEDLIVRLFRNRPEFRFEGAIHEQVRPSVVRHAGENSLKIAPLTIYHDGYLSEVVKKKNKIARNTTVLKQALLDSPASPFLLYSLGCEYFLLEDFQQALTLFQRTLALIPMNEGYLSDVVIKTGLCLFKLGQIEEMRKLLNLYRQSAPLSPELLFLSGLSHLDTGQLDLAESDLCECLDLLPENSPNPLTLRKHQVYQALGETYEARECWEEAARFYFLAARSKPNHLYPVKCLINIFRQRIPGQNIREFLNFCSSETKFALLEKLDWLTETDMIIFLVIGLLQDILSSVCMVAQALIVPRLKAILGEKASTAKEPRIALTLALAQSLVYLSAYQSHELGKSSQRCQEIIDYLIEILLWEARN